MEISALLLLTVGAVVLPIVGPLLGLVFVWASGRWTTSQKLIATAIVIVLLAVPLGLLFGASAGGGFTGPELTSPVPFQP